MTIIEVLNPANKAPNSEGRKEYLQKQTEALCSDVHLLEIDLLRAGMHTVAAPCSLLLQEGMWHYLISLSRNNHRGAVECWPNLMQQRLPRVSIPLAEGDPDVILDLQAVLDRCYDSGRYLREIDYHGEPSLPLPDEDTAWADALLRAKGLR